jgi:uncharacterized OB-fold protein
MWPSTSGVFFLHRPRWDSNMNIIDLKKESPLGVFQEHCRQGQLAYQVDPQGRAVFFPRVCAPGSAQELTWRVSEGVGTVYAVTVLYPKKDAPYDVALIDLDEGFRMMSRVTHVAPQDVRIGMRVKVYMDLQEGDVPLPFFKPIQTHEGGSNA